MSDMRKRMQIICAAILIVMITFALCGCSQEKTLCKDVSRYPEVFGEHAYLRTGYIVFPKVIPTSGVKGADFFDYASNDFLDPSAEIVLRCTYDDADFADEIERLESLVKTSPAGEKPVLKDDSTRFSVPAYIAEYAEDFAYEYAAVTGPREITYVYLAFRYPDEIESVPTAALPLNYEAYHTRSGARTSEPKDSYNIYEFDRQGRTFDPLYLVYG